MKWRILFATIVVMLWVMRAKFMCALSALIHQFPGGPATISVAPDKQWGRIRSRGTYCAASVSESRLRRDPHHISIYLLICFYRYIQLADTYIHTYIHMLMSISLSVSIDKEMARSCFISSGWILTKSSSHRGWSEPGFPGKWSWHQDCQSLRNI